jgi:hypothetical protein
VILLPQAKLERRETRQKVALKVPGRKAFDLASKLKLIGEHGG